MFLAPGSRGGVFLIIVVSWLAKLGGELRWRYNVLIPEALREINALVLEQLLLLSAIFFYISWGCFHFHSWILTVLLLLSCLLIHRSIIVCYCNSFFLLLLSCKDILRFGWANDRIITHIAQFRWLNFTKLLLAQWLSEISAAIVSWRVTSKVLILKRPHCLGFYLYLSKLWPVLL